MGLRVTPPFASDPCTPERVREIIERGLAPSGPSTYWWDALLEADA